MVDSPASPSGSAAAPEATNDRIRKRRDSDDRHNDKTAKERRKSHERDGGSSSCGQIESLQIDSPDGNQSLNYVDALPPEILIKLKKPLSFSFEIPKFLYKN